MIDVNHAGVLRFYVSLLALSGVLAASCGGGDDGGDDESSGGSGAGGQAASAGTSGASGTAGAGGSTSSGSSGASGGGSGATGTGGSMAAPVPCGSATCEPGTTRFLRPCCFDEATAKCGTMIAFPGMAMACNEIVEPDPQCDSVMSRIGQIPSCCTEDMRCGISLAMFGMPGCTSIEEAQMIAMGDGGTPDGMGGSGGAGGSMSNPFAIDLPAPKACE